MWEMKATRDAFGEALVELGKKNRKVVVLSGDLEDSTRAEYFKKGFPDRFFNLGIAEQDILGTAVGMSLDGLVPFTSSFAVFLTNRAYGILRISICYNKRKDPDPFIIGKANLIREGKDVTIIACGLMVSESLMASKILAGEGIEARIINMHTIKPIDSDIIVRSAKKTRSIVTAEEHQINGGLGSAVAEVLSQNHPVPLEMVAVKDTFGESGSPEELLKKYHLKDMDIVNAVKRVIKRK